MTPTPPDATCSTCTALHRRLSMQHRPPRSSDSRSGQALSLAHRTTTERLGAPSADARFRWTKRQPRDDHNGGGRSAALPLSQAKHVPDRSRADTSALTRRASEQAPVPDGRDQLLFDLLRIGSRFGPNAVNRERVAYDDEDLGPRLMDGRRAGHLARAAVFGPRFRRSFSDAATGARPQQGASSLAAIPPGPSVGADGAGGAPIWAPN
jgi:hypothetical protein